MKKSAILLILLCCVMVFGSISVAANTGDMSVTNGSHTLDAAYAYLGQQRLVDNCSAAIVYERNSDTLVYAWNVDAPVYPASLVKIMTAWLALERGNLADVVAVREEVLATVPEDAVSCDLLPDEVLTVQDLLYCMMVASGNDAAAVLADHVAGDQQTFVDWMNACAKQIGCTGTYFTNVHGIHDDAQVTTARDVARILKAAMENQQFAELFCTVNYTVPATNRSAARYLVTGNYLISNENKDSVQIYYDGRVTGGRTGVADDGTRCIAATAESGELSVISVVLGSTSKYHNDGYSVSVFGGYNETSRLLDYTFDGNRSGQIISKDQAVTQCRVINGDSMVVLGSDRSVFTMLPEGFTTQQLDYRYSHTGENFHAPIEKGDVISKLEIWNGTQCIAQADLYAMNSVDDITNYIKEQAPTADSNLALTIFLTVVLSLLAAAALLVVIRYALANLHSGPRKRSNSRRSHRRGR